MNHLAKQMFPGHVKYMQESFQDATSRPYGCLLCDLKPETPTDFRLRTNIFLGEIQFALIRNLGLWIVPRLRISSNQKLKI